MNQLDCCRQTAIELCFDYTPKQSIDMQLQPVGMSEMMPSKAISIVNSVKENTPQALSSQQHSSVVIKQSIHQSSNSVGGSSYQSQRALSPKKSQASFK